jgi:hypothetical protein
MARIPEMELDPQEKLDFTWDFSGRLATGEAIASFDFHDEPPQIVLTNTANTTNAVTAWVETTGAAVGDTYAVPCLITTDSTPARKHDGTIKFKIVNK